MADPIPLKRLSRQSISTVLIQSTPKALVTQKLSFFIGYKMRGVSILLDLYDNYEIITPTTLKNIYLFVLLF